MEIQFIQVATLTVGQPSKLLTISESKFQSKNEFCNNSVPPLPASAGPEMAYLTVEGTKLVLQQPDLGTKNGRRDFALLGLLYDSAARV